MGIYWYGAMRMLSRHTYLKERAMACGFVYACVCVCVCVRERERERERGGMYYRSFKLDFTELCGLQIDATGQCHHFYDGSFEWMLCEMYLSLSDVPNRKLYVHNWLCRVRVIPFFFATSLLFFRKSAMPINVVQCFINMENADIAWMLLNILYR